MESELVTNQKSGKKKRVKKKINLKNRVKKKKSI